jgi:hypothetical protein
MSYEKQSGADNATALRPKKGASAERLLVIDVENKITYIIWLILIKIMRIYGMIYRLRISSTDFIVRIVGKATRRRIILKIVMTTAIRVA